MGFEPHWVHQINWPVPSVCANADVTGSNPVEAPKNLFRDTSQLLKLRFHCDDHIFISFVFPQFTIHFKTIKMATNLLLPSVARSWLRLHKLLETGYRRFPFTLWSLRRWMPLIWSHSSLYWIDLFTVSGAIISVVVVVVVVVIVVFFFGGGGVRGANTQELQ